MHRRPATVSQCTKISLSLPATASSNIKKERWMLLGKRALWHLIYFAGCPRKPDYYFIRMEFFKQIKIPETYFGKIWNENMQFS